jgi:hypothetical protein
MFFILSSKFVKILKNFWENFWIDKELLLLYNAYYEIDTGVCVRRFGGGGGGVGGSVFGGREDGGAVWGLPGVGLGAER